MAQNRKETWPLARLHGPALRVLSPDVPLVTGPGGQALPAAYALLAQEDPEWLGPWHLLDQDSSENLRQEFQEETAAPNPAPFKDCQPFAASGASDDMAAFVTEDGWVTQKVIEVHLTWVGGAEVEGCPRCALYDDFWSWIQEGLLPQLITFWQVQVECRDPDNPHLRDYHVVKSHLETLEEWNRPWAEPDEDLDPEGGELDPPRRGWRAIMGGIAGALARADALANKVLPFPLGDIGAPEQFRRKADPEPGPPGGVDDTPFLARHDGAFEAVYVVLHPFWRFRQSVDMRNALRIWKKMAQFEDWTWMGLQAIRCADLTPDILEMLEQEPPYEPAPAQCLRVTALDDRQDYVLYSDWSEACPASLLERNAAETLSWRDVGAALGVEDLPLFCRVVMGTCVAPGWADGRESRLVENLHSFLRVNEWYGATSGALPAYLEKEVARLLLAAGCDSVVMEDGPSRDGPYDTARFLEPEFGMVFDYGEEAGTVTPALIRATDGSLLLETRQDPSYAFLVSKDYPFSLLYGSRARLESALAAVPLEGFFCDETTTPAWLAGY